MNTKNPKKRVIALYIILRAFVITILVLSFMQKNYNNVFMCILTLLLFTIPTIIDRKLNISLPSVLESIILIFIFAAEILGEIHGFYLKIPYWDTLLHTMNGFVMAAIGFAMIDILNQSPRLHFNMSPIFVAFVSFCFSMTIGVLWEFFEYGMDLYTFSDMQKDSVVGVLSSIDLNSHITNTPVIVESIQKTTIDGTVDGVATQMVIDGGYLDMGLVDTMADLTVNCIGALCFSIIGILYIKGRSHFAKSFIPQLKTKEEITESNRINKNKHKKMRGKNNEH